MKFYIYFRSIAIAILLFVAIDSQSKTASGDQDRATIAQLLRIGYVEYPNSRKPTTETLNNIAIQEGKMTGNFWETQYNPGAQKLVKALLLDQSAGGDLRLQYIVARMLRIKNRYVFIYLLNDYSVDLLPKVADSFGGSIKNGKAWPSANSMEKADILAQARARCEGAAKKKPLSGTYAGYLTIGTTYLNTPKAIKTRTSIVHELSHTQDVNVWAENQFYVDNKSFVYGKDGTHYLTEIIPSMSHAYHEGVANAFGYLYQHAKFEDRFRWFRRKGEMRVELSFLNRKSKPSNDARCMGAESLVSEDIWLFNQITNANIKEVKARKHYSDTDYAYFSMKDLPGEYIIQNESIVAMLVYSYMRHTNISQFSQIISDANKSIYRDKRSLGLPQLLHSMSKSHLKRGQSLEKIFHESPPAIPQPYMTPLAFLDYFTGYSAKTENEMVKIVGYNTKMQKWLRLYWTHRNTIKKGIDTSNPHWGDFEKIMINTGLRRKSR